jgi:hypothetical protein
MGRCEDETGMRGWEMEDRGSKIEDGGSRMGRAPPLVAGGAYVVSRES